MAQLSDDCFAFGSRPMPLAQAAAELRARVTAVAASELVALSEACGRVLAEALVAPISLPPFDNSAVDGFAVRHADLHADGETALPVVARVAAGQAAPHLPPRSAIRIFTGAPMPDGADTVFMQEDTHLDGPTVVCPPGLARFANSRQAGEDLAVGELALPAGRVLAPQDIALAAALGRTSLAVRRRLSVGVFSTGDELARPGAALSGPQIHDSNRPMLLALLARAGARAADLGILPDDAAALADALAGAADAHDLLLTSGGVSTGEEDHVKAALARVGRLDHWRVAIKPGRPVAMGTVRGAAIVGLPGNPVAVFVTFAHIVRPLLAALAGAAWLPPRPMPVESGFAYRKKEGRREYLRVSLRDAPGGPVAGKWPQDGAGVITSLTGTDGLLELEEARTTLA
ncbi:MAG: molybdopterin molybdotransferase MoeA, partial [Acetobacteraceae bacterium]|nr:molybdopterin molybdotransferase MoeA [Acetobacteraceae bacterium]